MTDQEIMTKALAILEKVEHPYRLNGSQMSASGCAKWTLSGKPPEKADGRIGSSPYIMKVAAECTCGLDEAISLLKRRLA